MISSMKTWVVVALVGATVVAFGVAVVAGYRTGYASGVQEVTAKWEAEKAQIAAAQAEEVMKARQREKALTELLEQQRLERRREVDRILRDHRAAVERLRDRPEARASAGGVPQGAAAGVGCTGEGLSRGDAAFLVGLAADAAQTQAALRACQAAYNDVRKQLSGEQPWR